MSLRTWSPGKEINQPRGMWSSLTNRRKNTPARASFMQNMRVQFGTVRGRPGTSRVVTTSGKVTGISNWINPAGTNFVLLQDGSSIKYYKQSDESFTTLLSGLGVTRAPSFAPLDVWNYFCGRDANGFGTFQAHIFDGLNTDVAFRAAPKITAWTAVDGGAGQCTSGQHFIGFVYQNRTGYPGVPVTASVYAISDATNASPAVLTATGNNIQTGQQVTVTGVLGNTAVNLIGIATVVVAGSTFTLTDLAGNQINGNGAYTSGGTVSNPIQATLNAGLRQINISVTLPPLSDGGAGFTGVQAKLFLIATRADNPALWYFIPTDAQTGQVGSQPVPYNTAATLNFVFSLSDEDIASSLSGDTAQANFLLLSQAADGTGPFNPNFVVAYGNRMCYGAGTTLYASDINKPQQIAADTNQIRMQNQRYIGAAFTLPGNTNLYLTGDRWMGYVTDTGDSPSTWSPPIQVSDALGAPFPDCVCAATGGNWAWIVTESGPYMFDGAFSEMPLTYLVSGTDPQGNPVGWDRVNWNASYAIQIRDDVSNLKLYIAAPLDGATEPNYMFCIDYRQGKTFDTCDISLDVFNPSVFSAIGVVKEIVTGKTNLWVGETGSLARFDSTTEDDQGAAVDKYWTSGLCRGTGDFASAMIRLGAMDIWARGNAPLDANGDPTLLITVFGPDGVQQVPVTLLSTQGVPSALTTAPGISYMSKFDFRQIENYYVQFRTNAPGAWFELSGFICYSKPDLFNR